MMNGCRYMFFLQINYWRAHKARPFRSRPQCQTLGLLSHEKKKLLILVPCWRCLEGTLFTSSYSTVLFLILHHESVQRVVSHSVIQPLALHTYLTTKYLHTVWAQISGSYGAYIRDIAPKHEDHAAEWDVLVLQISSISFPNSLAS